MNKEKINYTFKINKQWDSYNDFIEFLEQELKELRKHRALNATVSNSKLKTNDIVALIIGKLNIKRIEVINESEDNILNDDDMLTNSKNLYFIQSYKGVGLWQRFDIEEFCRHIVVREDHFKITNLVNELTRMFPSTNSDFISSTIKKLNLPPKHMILTSNGLFNMKTKELITDNKIINKYDYIHMFPIPILPENQVDKLSLEIVTRIFKDWSDNNPDKLTYMLQLAFSTIEGNGRKKFHFILGPGGNGKSSFLNILSNLAGLQYVEKLNLQDLMQDNHVNNISYNSKLLIGHDLATNFKFNSSTTSRFKELVTEEGFKANVKYESSRIIVHRGVKIQSSNTTVSFPENTPAFHRRLRILEWTTKTFSPLNNDLNFNLDELINSYNHKDEILRQKSRRFYEAVVFYVMNNIDYFEDFIETDALKEATANMINNSDNVYNFMQYLQEQDLLIFDKIPTSTMYKMYVNWLTIDSANKNIAAANSMKNKTLTARLQNICQDFGYEYIDEPIKGHQFKKVHVDESIIQNHFDIQSETIKPGNKYRYFQSKNSNVTNDELDNIRQQLKNNEISDINALSNHEIHLLNILIDIENNEKAYEVINNIS